MTASSKEANADQAEHWTAEAGPKWVGHQAQLDALMTPVLDLLVAAASPAPGDRILDIGCGTGASTLEAARTVGASGHVTGADISPTLLDRARERAAAAGLQNTSFLNVDAQTHDFPQARFDRMMSRFGVMFFADPPAAFANISGALVPGAPLTFVAWAGVAHNPWFDIPRRAATDQLGDMPAPDPHAPGPMAFQDTGHVLGLLAEAGLEEATAEIAEISLTPPGTAAETAAFACEVGIAARMIREFGASEADAMQIERAVAEAFVPFETDRGLRVPARLNLYRARTPA